MLKRKNGNKEARKPKKVLAKPPLASPTAVTPSPTPITAPVRKAR